MKLRILSLCFISVFATFFTVIAFAEFSDYRVSAIRYKSRDGLPKIFEGKYENQNFLEELSGIRKHDDLATNLPAGLIGKDIARLIAPNENLAFAISVGVKPFPYRLNSYVVIVCFAEYESIKAYKKPYSCQKENSSPRSRNDVVYLGLIEYDLTASKPMLIAKPFKIEADWYFRLPEQFRSPSHEKSNLLPYGWYECLDFAPFKVSDTQTAFGLRVWRPVGYSGGGGNFEVLSLFMVDNNQVINILSEPIYFNLDLSGGMNKDRTRRLRSLYEGENVLVVLPNQTDGYYDLPIKAVDSDWQKTFSWDSSLKRYLPSDRTATLNRLLDETFNLRIKGLTYF